MLTLSNLHLTIGNQHILRGIDAHIEQGEVVGLIGPNGSGKTTLFNTISGFLKPTQGSLQFRNEDITKLSPAQRAQRGIGRVFQNFGIFRDMTLEENILVALEALPSTQRKELGPLRPLVQQTLEHIQLAEKAREKASSLSGGQMRLLEIARTLACGKELFLLDEPTAGVSPKMTGQVADIIKQLKEQKRTVLIIEHDLPFIAQICDRVFVLDVGSIVLEDSPQEVQKDQKLKEIYFGADPTT